MAAARHHRSSMPLSAASVTGGAARAAGNGKPAAEGKINGSANHVPTSVGSNPEILLPEGSWYLFAKTGLDRVLAFVLLLVSSPLIFAAMMLVKATSRGPALYSQTRVGRYGTLFTLYKIRSMIVESESLTGACWSTPGDQRVTTVGRWLRRSHIDELPQLWNVLRGDMSLIGPRPERPEFVPTLEQAIPYYRDRLLVRPGITGFAQVQWPPDTGLDSVRTKLAYDLHYVQTLGFWFDVRILGATAARMVGASYALVARLFRFLPRAMLEERYHSLAEEAQRKKLAVRNGAARADSINPVPLFH